MREQEMRLRVFRFLRARMRNMIMPATVGIGIAVGGCSENQAVVLYMAPPPQDAAQVQDVGGLESLVIVLPDAAQLSTADGPEDLAQPDAMPKSGDMGTLRDIPGTVDVSIDSNGVDVGSASLDSSIDTGAVIAKYTAPMYDAGSDGTPVVGVD